MKYVICMLGLLFLTVVQTRYVTYSFKFTELGDVEDPTILKEYMAHRDVTELQLEDYENDNIGWQVDETATTTDISVYSGEYLNKSNSNYQQWFIECIEGFTCEQQEVVFTYSNYPSTDTCLHVHVNPYVMENGFILGLCQFMLILLLFI